MEVMEYVAPDDMRAETFTGMNLDGEDVAMTQGTDPLLDKPGKRFFVFTVCVPDELVSDD